MKKKAKKAAQNPDKRRTKVPGTKLIGGLTIKEDAFCMAYTAIGEDTCDHGTKSAEAAGYAVPHNSAWRLLKRIEIRERIAEIHKSRMDKLLITPEGVLMKLEHLRVRAEAKGDLATAKGCVELQGKYLAMFSDNIRLEVPDLIEFNHRKAIEFEKIAEARVLLESSAENTLPAADDGYEYTLPAAAETEPIIVQDDDNEVEIYFEDQPHG